MIHFTGCMKVTLTGEQEEEKKKRVLEKIRNEIASHKAASEKWGRCPWKLNLRTGDLAIDRALKGRVKTGIEWLHWLNLIHSVVILQPEDCRMEGALCVYGESNEEGKNKGNGFCGVVLYNGECFSVLDSKNVLAMTKGIFDAKAKEIEEDNRRKRTNGSEGSRDGVKRMRMLKPVPNALLFETGGNIEEGVLSQILSRARGNKGEGHDQDSPPAQPIDL